MSVTAAVKSFGLTMAIGLPLAYLLAPMGGKAGIVSRRVERG
jgi:predicted exporter